MEIGIPKETKDLEFRVGLSPSSVRVLKENGHKICIDGLNNDAFIQVNRKKLGFDLAKLQWNADFRQDLESGKENEELIKSIKKTKNVKTLKNVKTQKL